MVTEGRLKVKKSKKHNKSHKKSKKKKFSLPPVIMPSVKDMILHLNKHVRGNERAKETLAVSFKGIEYRSRFPELDVKKGNVLLFGHTGTGKTYMTNLLTSYCKVPLISINMTGRTPAGFWGQDIADDFSTLLDWNNPVFKEMMEEYDSQDHSDIIPPMVKNAQYTVVYMDEIDKVVGSGSTSMGSGLQNEIIGLSEDQALFDGTLTTKNMLFIGSGAFVGLEDVVKARLNSKHSMGFDTGTLYETPESLYDAVTAATIVFFMLYFMLFPLLLTWSACIVKVQYFFHLIYQQRSFFSILINI
jgi:ATP-dependent Clp protease ATP-binding subunit ClpX